MPVEGSERYRGGRLAKAAAAFSFVLAVLVQAADASERWFVMSRSDGCLDLSVLTRGDRLPRVPTSPDDYAEMMRARGHQPTLGLPPGVPAELAAKVVMVKVRDDRAPVFVHEDVGKQSEGRR